jgi:hypothetical protein
MIFYRHIYIPSVTYPLSSTFFTEKVMDTIQNQANRSLTQHCGYSANTAFDLLYGPSLYGCPQYTNLYDSQSSTTPDVHQALAHRPRAWTNAPNMRRMVAISSMDVPSHSRIPTTKASTVHFKKESKFINSIRQFLASTKLSLQLDDSQIPALQ